MRRLRAGRFERDALGAQVGHEAVAGEARDGDHRSELGKGGGHGQPMTPRISRAMLYCGGPAAAEVRVPAASAGVMAMDSTRSMRGLDSIQRSMRSRSAYWPSALSLTVTDL